ncbi:phosphohydrolase [Flavobacterium akiainvivens]|uniref:Phosphohydrolase n=1 Tax=Flavobacterium akiainvivens TaxID=1202724 RepID=A0A0M9VJL3_9FLAO|nr:Pycsar system effector family protein [Flavobacterium akiainvivens]KOS07860.1 phosphohydrolase [Flavobacterium akiainvivens]SFQ27676.1 Predicted metal-dependent phosphohydrolase, HD superfamily [Flavobacterium akiainvivens]
MDIIEKAEAHVFSVFKDKLSPDYIYHNFNHTMRVVHAAATIAQAEGVSKDEMELLALAAWFHDLGYIDGGDNHEVRGGAMAKAFLEKEGYAPEKAAKVAKLIEATQLHYDPQDNLENIIKDADCAHFADPNYLAISELLREEWRIVQGQVFSDIEWAVANRLLLLHKHRYYTNYAKNVLQIQKDANIAALQEVIYNLSNAKKKKDKKKKEKEEKQERPDRGVETMFRVTLNNHTRLSDIADSKANILLQVNSIIISISLTTLIPKLDSPGNSHLVMPTFILILFTTLSIIFAILSTRPKVTTGTFTREDITNRKVNLLFFGNFYKMPLEEFDWAMKELMRDRDYLYSSMIKDLYFLGRVLNRKYTMLRITYTIFMIGIIISVLAFVNAYRML